MINSLYDKFKPWSATGSVYIISDTHFDDSDCKFITPYWISAQEATDILKRKCHKGSTLIHLGDVGDAVYLNQLKCYKVLISGNHDILSKVSSYFDEIYTGPLFIADRILLSHEPIYGMEKFALNIHGHNHSGHQWNYDETNSYITHINMASNVCNYMPINLGEIIKDGFLSKIPNYHRITIDKAKEKSIMLDI
jgi:calcineurin-like phosphoesterase family protein